MFLFSLVWIGVFVLFALCFRFRHPRVVGFLGGERGTGFQALAWLIFGSEKVPQPCFYYEHFVFNEPILSFAADNNGCTNLLSTSELLKLMKSAIHHLLYLFLATMVRHPQKFEVLQLRRKEKKSDHPPKNHTKNNAELKPPSCFICPAFMGQSFSEEANRFTCSLIYVWSYPPWL